MPKKITNYRELYLRQLNLLKFRNEFYGLADIIPSIKTAITKYEKWNAIPLRRLAEKEQELIALHVEHSDGKPLWEPAGNGGGYIGANNMQPVFINADSAREFNDAWQFMLNQPCEITL